MHDIWFEVSPQGLLGVKKGGEMARTMQCPCTPPNVSYVMNGQEMVPAPALNINKNILNPKTKKARRIELSQ